MSTLSSPEITAKQIISAFPARKIGAEISYLHLEDYFKRHRYALKDIAQGLYYAQNMGWIRVNSFDSIALLDLGVAVLRQGLSEETGDGDADT